MLSFYQKLIVLSFVLLLPFTIAAQEDTTKGKPVVWAMVEGNDEVAVAMPQGYESFVDGGYWIGSGTDVKKHITVMRFLNRVLLMVEMYEGNAKDIQKIMVSRLTEGKNAYQLTKDEVIGDVARKQFKLSSKERTRIQDFYLFKKRLYVVQTISPDEKNSIAEVFLGSVQLGKNPAVKKPSEQFIETDPIRVEEPPQENPDRGIVVLHKPRPSYTTEARVLGVTGDVVVKVLFSASGKVAKTEVVSGPRELRERALAAVAKIRFLPAEKDGKLVSVWKEMSYSFRIY